MTRRLGRGPRAVRLADAVLGADEPVALLARVDGLVAEEAARHDHRAPLRVAQLVVALAICVKGAPLGRTSDERRTTRFS